MEQKTLRRSITGGIVLVAIVAIGFGTRPLLDHLEERRLLAELRAGGVNARAAAEELAKRQTPEAIPLLVAIHAKLEEQIDVLSSRPYWQSGSWRGPRTLEMAIAAERHWHTEVKPLGVEQDWAGELLIAWALPAFRALTERLEHLLELPLPVGVGREARKRIGRLV